MLNDDVLQAVAHGGFRIYVVETLEEAMTLVTDRSWDEGEWSIVRAVTDHLRDLRKIYLQGQPSSSSTVA
jgi:hypothetical protein